MLIGLLFIGAWLGVKLLLMFLSAVMHLPFIVFGYATIILLIVVCLNELLRKGKRRV